MKLGKTRLNAAILAVLALPAIVQANPAINPALAGVHTAEAPRVTRAIDLNAVSTVGKSHLALIEHAAATGSVPDATPMSHMALVLKRSPQRQAALDALLADQHDPHSSRFHKWISPDEFGENFGVDDADIAAVSKWLTAQGFTVHGVYPNRMQLDISGTAGAVKHAFHTQLQRFSVNGESHIANTTDISVPNALKDVVAGVAGLHDFRPKAMNVGQRIAEFNAGTKGLKIVDNGANAKPMAVPFQGGARGLVPFDMVKMYGADSLHAAGITGKGITIAVIEDHAMVSNDWYNFVAQFNLKHWGGTFAQIQPRAQAHSGQLFNCTDPTRGVANSQDDGETLLDAEWSTAMAPSAHIEVASCSDFAIGNTPNAFGGVFTAAINLVNLRTGRPDIISASYGYGESFIDTGSKSAFDLMWAQADAEGISVFVSSGDSGSNPSFNGGIINSVGVGTNGFGSSPHVTVVGGTDTADVLDKTTGQYFRTKLTPDYGSAKSYVPEIPWNQSCGNDAAAKDLGYASGLAFCQADLAANPDGNNIQSEAGSGGPSFVNAKPAWQSMVRGYANDGWRDEPDVSLFAGSFNGYSWVIVCTANYPCQPHFPGSIAISGGTSLSSPMFAGIQALVDQSLWQNGLPKDQGNASPVLYALAAQEYGGPTGTAPPTLAQCSSDNGATGTDACVFHNVTRGGISTNCIQQLPNIATPDCYFYGNIANFFGSGPFQIGLTSKSANKYDPAYPATPGWSFATGLGSVNAGNLVTAWQNYVTK